MPLGKASKLKLATCDARLQQFVTALVADVDAGKVPGVSDITVLCGYRGQAEQNAAFQAGTSKLIYPHSKHNRVPSMAVDLAPYPIDWKDTEAFEALRRYALALASRMGIRIRVISWDLPHYELI
jgi:peptidoglycan L-alanyl-D-glutamate endopeptidase CwlK